ncbi:MAG: hypothetical protein FRX48_09028 [Lasallia pustulata]|uniref:Enoyl reductase (ER) domain-containing protein n=1 Tax=Lasallia pustulata TaxID=136370 RepID=A0A5M8PE10_9LECA|nr:MAG: hypothetical protein FRX48_09028 [Lasallia pustulata]
MPHLCSPPRSVQTAILQSPTGTLTIASAPTPSPSPTQVLVRTHAVALNPTDHKMPQLHPSPGALTGCDFAGAILSLGASVGALRPDLQIGDRVCGAVHGSNPIDHASGAFAEYVVAEASLVLKVPAVWGWEEAAALLRLAGYTPLATCSPASAALVRDYGASHTFAYTSPSCADDIRAAVAAPLRYALDCITDAESARTCYAALGRTGGRYVSLEACRSEWKTRKAVKGEFVMGYEIFGKEVALGGEYGRRADEGKKERAVKWCREVQGLVKEGKIRSHPVRVLEDGWEGVLEGLRRLRSGEVRREKLVVRVEGEENEVEGEGYNQD